MIAPLESLKPVEAVKVRRWPSERPLAVLVALAGVALWVALALSVVGLACALVLAVAFGAARVAFVSQLRGSAVRLGPQQMPDLWERVVELAERVGLRRRPEVYVMQAGGSLNALATRFLRANFVVLHSELLDACGQNEAALDFIVAHELGHVRAGHLRHAWLRLPGLLVPFLGSAYSRAREYTCDRYALAASSDPKRALDGLCILAAGARHASLVNRSALAAQRGDLETVWMKLGHWLSSHPPIAHRLAALDPALDRSGVRRRAASLGALALVTFALLAPPALAVFLARPFWPQIRAAIAARVPLALAAAAQPAAAGVQTQADRVETARSSILSLAQAAEAYRRRASAAPRDRDELYRTWTALHPGAPEPLDPWHGTLFGYRADGEHYVIFSAGPDANGDEDDLWYSSRSADAARAGKQTEAQPAEAAAPEAKAKPSKRPARASRHR